MVHGNFRKRNNQWILRVDCFPFGQKPLKSGLGAIVDRVLPVYGGEMMLTKVL